MIYIESCKFLIRERPYTGFLKLNINYLRRGEGVNKNMLSRQKFDTHLKSYYNTINNAVIRDKKTA